MTDQERYQEYINNYCSKCKNKESNDCEIRIVGAIAKCEYYEGAKNER